MKEAQFIALAKRRSKLEDPKKLEQEIQNFIYDESRAFTKMDLFIESILFVSDSTLVVLLFNKEIRVLYT
jgi:predicted metal-dependent hydrolase